jgi:hypothetical protein
MWYIKTKRYPVEGFNAITHWPFVFYKRDDQVMRNHERIHGGQQLECGALGLIIATVIIGFGGSWWWLALVGLFYLIYFTEWLLKGYRGISFEREAYKNQHDKNYKRRFFGWVGYLKSPNS